MSRHRSPGRPAQPRPASGRTRSDRRARHHATPAARHGLAAAALSGGALVVFTPLVATDAVPGGTTAALALTTDQARTSVRTGSPAADGLAVDGGAAGPTIASDPGGDLRRPASIAPVGGDPEPEAVAFSVAGLLKSAGLADAARAEEQRAACEADLDGLGRVKPWVRDAARFLSCLYGQPDLIGVAGRARHSDHPAGLAVDFMMRGGRGDRLAACALANQQALGISYVIWEQRINFGDGWQRMEDRGGDTENHVDHVHVSFERHPGASDPITARCS